jgi:DNA ligase-1
MKDRTFSELATLCEVLEKTKKRKDIAKLIGNFLSEISKDEIPRAVNLILGRSAYRPLDLGGASVIEVVKELVRINEKDYSESFLEAPDFGEAVKNLFERSKLTPAGERLTIEEVSHILEEIADVKGRGSRKRKKELLLNLLNRATPLEAKYVVKNVVGEMRHGVDEGMILKALSSTLHIDINLLRRSHMLTGDIGEVAKTCIIEGADGLKKIGLHLFRPIKPMLAQMAYDVEDVFSALKVPFALEYKIDGARVQIHKKGKECRLFSRSLVDVSASLPDIVNDIIRNVHIEEAIFEGEVFAVNKEGFPLPFQVIMRRLGRVHEIERLVKEVPVRLYIFDILYKDRDLLIDRPYKERWEILENVGITFVPRIIPEDKEKGNAFFRRAIEEGFEGLVAKALSSLYTPGIRGKAWLKVKKAISLDLVIVAADWGYGRRHNWLSNYHLAARDESTGDYVPIGKTFKGLTDEEFKEMTKRLLRIKISESQGTVVVEPEAVVEVLFSDIQRSPHYKSGLALRFARISRIRDDKTASEIDSIQAIEKIYKEQLKKTGITH